MRDLMMFVLFWALLAGAFGACLATTEVIIDLWVRSHFMKQGSRVIDE